MRAFTKWTYAALVKPRSSRYIVNNDGAHDVEKKSQHVVTNPKGGWAVRQSGASRASKTFSKQGDAENFARNAARKEGSEVFIHRRDGTIRDVDSYRSDPSISKKS